VSSTGDEVAEEDCGCDESSKPEEHCQALDTGDDPWVCKAFELPRGESKVDQGEKSPKRCENQEVDLRGRAIAIDAGDIGTGCKDQNCEDNLHDANRKDEVHVDLSR